MHDETAWLVEFDGVVPEVVGIAATIQYLALADGRFQFDRDVTKALRFARKQDAEAVMSLKIRHLPECWRPHYRAAEHMWCGPLTAAPAASTAKHICKEHGPQSVDYCNTCANENLADNQI